VFLELAIFAIALAAVSGGPGLLMTRTSPWGERSAAAGMVCAALAGLVGAFGGLRGSSGASLGFPWQAVGGGRVGLDPLSAFFLVPVFLMGGLGAVYGLGYWPQRRHPRSGRRVRLFWGLLTAGMALLVVSRHTLVFLLGWEVMALSAFFLVAAEDQRAGTRQAGWVYLISTHVCALTLFGLFALWRQETGSALLQPVGADVLSPGMLNLLFVLAFLGFGVKAGIMPLHFWLPGAHAAAPSHVSAVMSGVVIKMGVYGMVRWFALLPHPPPAWGGLVLLAGAASGVLGVVFAIGQHDLKRLLAYHSVENIGIILMGLGVALIGRSLDRPEWVALGLAGCLLHVWNHSLFKALLFFGAGAVLHAAHTRQIDRLGGLAKTMPWTAAFFLAGAVAICGLPPLNGFVSEWFIYLGLFKRVQASGGSGLAPLLGVPALAMIGALAVACFVKVYGVVFLGAARTRAARCAREVPFAMRLPMGVLVLCCAAIGLAPWLVAPAVDAAAACWCADAGVAPVAVGSLVPLGALSAISVVAALAAGGTLAALARRTAAVRTGATWDCGYAQPTPRMQYTAGSFAQMLVRLFSGVLRPKRHVPDLTRIFPRPARAHSHVDEAVLDRVLLPAGRRIEEGVAWLHRFQRGLTQHYMLYILLVLLVFLCSVFSFKPFVAQWFTR
jgi:hydrogenase-4 component B